MRLATALALVIAFSLGGLARSMAADVGPVPEAAKPPPPAAAISAPAAPDWGALIAAAKTTQIAPIAAQILHPRQLNGTSRAVVLECADGFKYAVKAIRTDRPTLARMIFTEHVIGRVGRLLGAPIPEIALISISQELIDSNKQTEPPTPNKVVMDGIIAGIAHGSRLLEDASAACEGTIQHADQGDNARRFGYLAVLFAWIGSGDRQFLYLDKPPRLVHSVDHGFLFPGSERWSATTLQGAAKPQIDQVLRKASKPEYIQEAINSLSSISPEQLASAIATAPEAWGINDADRHATADYLHRQQRALVDDHSPKKEVGGAG
jgi:hypothetical protein